MARRGSARPAARSASGSPIHSSTPSGAGDLVGDELAEAAVLRIDSPDELAGEPAVRQRVVAVRRADRPLGLGVGEPRGDRVPVERLGERDRRPAR